MFHKCHESVFSNLSGRDSGLVFVIVIHPQALDVSYLNTYIYNCVPVLLNLTENAKPVFINLNDKQALRIKR